MSTDDTSETNDVVVYTGEGGVPAPQNVVRVRVDPSVTTIPVEAFFQRTKLTEVELCEGLVEIGAWSFSCCDRSITKINIPNSLRRIRDGAFAGSLRTPICLHDDIESIGTGAFSSCIFTNFRVPPLITVIPHRIFHTCKSMFSLELSENITEIEKYEFYNCHCLRNVAIPPNAILGDNIFIEMTDLQRLFGSEARIIRELQHRFDRLPIHKLVYYQSYYQGVLQNVIAAMNMRSIQSRTLRSKLDPTGNHQDCLGMTSLHILTCSSVHNLELYRVIVEKYPTNLITEDRWGALPLLYAFWGAAPAEIIDFLLESYQSLYPTHVFNWTMMVETMGRCDTPKESIENLLCVRQMYFPEQPIDWDFLLNEFVKPSKFHQTVALFQERMQFLFTHGMSTWVEGLAFKIWRDCIKQMVCAADFKSGRDNLNVLRSIRAKVAHFEEEVSKLEEITTILELTLWKLRMNEKIPEEKPSHCRKKVKTDKSSIRRQCRVTCGADVVIRLVLPYLITV